MKTIDFSYFIERYIAGEMNSEEMIWFEKELEGNEKLRKEVELRKKADAIISDREILNLRSKLKQIEKKREVIVPARRRTGVRNIRYAAVAGAIVLLGCFALFQKNDMSNSEILDRYYKSYEATAPSRSENTELNSDYNLALEYYKVHDYKSAAVYFSKVIESDSRNMQSTLLYGVSNLETSNYPEAKQSFVKVIDDNNNLFIEDAQWYLALCYIKTNEQTRAREQLTGIKNSKSIYRKDAVKILRNLK